VLPVEEPTRRPANEPGRIRSLAAMARAVGQSNTLERLLELSAERARVALRAASVSVSRLEPGGTSVRTIVNVGDLGPHEERWPENETYEMNEFADLDLRVDEVVTWTWALDDPNIPPHECELLNELDKYCSLAAPLIVDGRLWGEFYATRGHGAARFDQDDVAYLEALLAILAGSVSRASREESLQQLAYHDPLTGLHNRRALDEAAARAFDVPPGGRREVVVVAVDIDGLKLVNDRHGHLAGDQLLKSAAAELLRSFARLPGSLVARVGGDEFTVLVTDRPLSKVVQVADEMNQRDWEYGAEAGLSSGAAGVVLTPDLELTPSELFAAADRALYVAKRRRPRSTVVAPEVAVLSVY
jgi:diguanylate cyclase (GGDEF)-like protein